MSQTNDLLGANVEPIHGLPYTQAVVRVCEQRAALLEGMTRTRGFKVIEARFRKLRADTRAGAHNATDAELDAKGALGEVFMSLCDIAPTHRMAADFAAKNVAVDRTPFPRGEFPGGMTVQVVIDNAAAVGETVQHPGWGVFLREIGARLRVMADLLTMTRGPARDAIRNLYNAHLCALGEIKQIFDLGMDAEAWQRAQLEALERKGKE